MNHIAIKRMMFLAAALFLTSTAWATELYIPEIKAKAGETVDIPVKLDLADNLAGVKLVLKYDADALILKKAVKSKETSPLMHIINDKKPGTLVVVMAGAKGIGGKDFALVVLGFEIKKDLKDKKTAKLEIAEVQLMNDQLKDIQCNIKVSPLVILSDGAEKSVSAQAPEKAEEPKPATEISEKKEILSEQKAENAAVEPAVKDSGKSEGDMKKDSEKSEPSAKPADSASPSK